MEHAKHAHTFKTIHGELPDNVEYIFGILPRALKSLYREMNLLKTGALPLKNIRVFRGRFCKIVRKFNGVSVQEFYERLDQYPNTELFRKKFPSSLDHYELCPDFVSKFEDDTNSIHELCRFGFLFGFGFPSCEYTKLVAQMCKAEREHEEFEQLYQKLEYLWLNPMKT